MENHNSEGGDAAHPVKGFEEAMLSRIGLGIDAHEACTGAGDPASS